MAPRGRRLTEQIHSEHQVVAALLDKGEALVMAARTKGAHGGAAAAGEQHPDHPSRGKKSGRFLRRQETPPEAATAIDGDVSPPEKRRKTTAASPIVEVEVEVIEPTMPKAQRDRLYGLLASLSADTPLPPHIVGLMRSQCCCVVDPNGEEMDVDLSSAKDAALFQLLNLLVEFAQQQTTKIIEEQEPPKIEASDATSSSSICDLLEDGEIADEGAAMGMDICGGVSPLIVDSAQLLPLLKQQEDDELIDIYGGVSPVSVNNFPDSPRSSSSRSDSSSSSSSSNGSGSSSSSSGASSGSSSCAGSSSLSSGSDTDADADSASNRPDTTTDHPTEAEVKPMVEHEVMEQDKKLITERAAASPASQLCITDMGIDICGGVSPLVVDKAQFSPLPKQQQEDDELIDICGGIDSPVSVSKFPETPRSSSSDSSSSSSCSGSSSSSERNDSASSRPDTTADHPTEAEVKPMEEQELIARAQERQKLQRELERKAARELERKAAREQLQEMKRTAQPVFDIIDPRDMKQLGISGEAQYIVSPVKSRDSLRRRGGGLLQRLGFFLKAEF
ncbi:LOW QUALITY PROTEIN: lisH domain-containing protein C1711.05-like [Oryza glaberrima]|uniref:LOW QUALITY PROTEIN: lisH domain-containing protein C1711.05-like n=1 Tax=Oryza glaberrima TaxID=4538 RepID=UPI00224BF978|nr:LOW QUALITY PROTEIN: lisH domain-containing protein C1711.05-like [Oryza glaberrima]